MGKETKSSVGAGEKAEEKITKAPETAKESPKETKETKESAEETVEQTAEEILDEYVSSRSPANKFTPLDEEGGETAVKDDDFIPKTDDEEGEDEDTSTPSEEDAASKEDDGKKIKDIDDLSLEDFEELKTKDEIPEEDKKSGVQKRIDKLVAEKKALEERLTKLESSGKKDEVPEYTDAQLRTAMAKAVEDGDSNLLWEIQEYRIKKAQREAIDGERKRQSDMYEQQRKKQQEWTSIIDEYSYLADSKEPALYNGSHRDLNIGNPQSLVFKVASELFKNPERAERYHKDGGQRLAVSDAIRIILRKKNASVASKETKILKRQLAKEKQKSSVSSGKAVKTEQSEPFDSKTSLENYLEERKRSKVALAGEI